MPQDPNDEAASVLLARIRAELDKENRMLKAHLHGKLRRSAEDDDAVRPLEDTTTAILFERLA